MSRINTAASGTLHDSFICLVNQIIGQVLDKAAIQILLEELNLSNTDNICGVPSISSRELPVSSVAPQDGTLHVSDEALTT
ncbi:unnamed protein product [Coregonus sp. 'balchen']|nr:unnamed protein product [Coregonus sp. 'balchen']